MPAKGNSMCCEAETNLPAAGFCASDFTRKCSQEFSSTEGILLQVIEDLARILLKVSAVLMFTLMVLYYAKFTLPIFSHGNLCPATSAGISLQLGCRNELMSPPCLHSKPRLAGQHSQTVAEMSQSNDAASERFVFIYWIFLYSFLLCCVFMS